MTSGYRVTATLYLDGFGEPGAARAYIEDAMEEMMLNEGGQIFAVTVDVAEPCDLDEVDRMMATMAMRAEDDDDA